jgi:hypothetical protein
MIVLFLLADLFMSGFSPTRTVLGLPLKWACAMCLGAGVPMGYAGLVGTAVEQTASTPAPAPAPHAVAMPTAAAVPPPAPALPTVNTPSGPVIQPRPAGGFAAQPADPAPTPVPVAAPTVVVSEVLLLRREHDRERERLAEQAEARAAAHHTPGAHMSGGISHATPHTVASRLTSAATSASSGHTHH